MERRRRLNQQFRDVLLDRARAMRKELAPAERLLWSRLRGDQLGYRFRRQHRLGPYILDFYCHAARLVVELDGDSHATEEGTEKDEVRDAYLQDQLLRVMRFSNLEVFNSLDEVVRAILDACERSRSPSPLPSPRGREREDEL